MTSSASITVDDFLMFCRRTIGFYADAISRLDDETVNNAPVLPGANTPFQITTHALAAARWWTDHVVCGHPSDRDRAGEFESAGTVAELTSLADETVAMLEALAPEMAAATELRFEASTTSPLEGEWTVGAALIHAYEELAQHLGHLQITVDLLERR